MNRQVRDERIEQRRLAGARRASDQHMLRRSFAELHRLQLRRASAAQRHFDAAAAVARPPLIGRRQHARKWHFDATRILRRLAGGAHGAREHRIARGLVDRQRKARERFVVDDDFVRLDGERYGVRFQIGMMASSIIAGVI